MVTAQMLLALVATFISNAALVGTLAWHLSARLTAIEGRIHALERGPAAYQQPGRAQTTAP